MVNTRLTERAALLRFDETLQQSLSGNRCGRKLLRPGDLSMPSPAASSTSVRTVLRRFRRNRRGSAAVEFALVAPVFFALLFAIIETAIVFFAGQVLETITQQSARMILTGQAQNAGYTQGQFKTYVCNQIPALFTCANDYVEVQSYPAFANVTLNSQIDANNNFDSSNMQYNPGGPGQIVVVRLFYQWPLFVTGLGYNISNLAGSKRLLAATSAFQNEPF
jgi:Flp pilus assembly protein TadG